MDMGFANIGPLARHRRPPIRFLFIGSRLCSALLSCPASGRVLFCPLRFAITSPPSDCEEDFHLQAVKHARHTMKRPRVFLRAAVHFCKTNTYLWPLRSCLRSLRSLCRSFLSLLMSFWSLLRSLRSLARSFLSWLISR